VKLAQDLSEEEQEAVREGLSEEEKAVFDILTKPEPELTPKEREQVKAVARSLIVTLKREKLVLDWTKKEQAKGAVRQAIEVALDDGLPDAYDEDLFNLKCENLFRHVYDAYQGGEPASTQRPELPCRRDILAKNSCGDFCMYPRRSSPRRVLHPVWIESPATKGIATKPIMH
jgi:hypothetical protein